MMTTRQAGPLFDTDRQCNSPLWIELFARTLIVLAIAAAPLSVLALVLYYVVNTPLAP